MRSPAETAPSSASRELHSTWECACSGDPDALASARSRLARLVVPGEIALRCRYRHLLDARSTPPGPVDRCSEELWTQIVRTETSGDLALVRFPERAPAVFEELRGLEYSTTLQIVTVNAAQGLGDAARQVDDHQQASRHLTEALEIAAQDGYRFGQVRALVSLGYLTMTVSSAHEARAHFMRALSLAEEIPDPLFAANARLGAAEAELRLKHPADLSYSRQLV